MKQLSPATFIDWLKENPQQLETIDVREYYEYCSLHLVNSKCIPLTSLAFDLEKITPKKKIIFVSSTGRKSAEAIKIAEESNKFKGNIYNLEKGLEGILEHPLGSLTLTHSRDHSYPKIPKILRKHQL